jgi:hypothetical protein
MVLISFDDWKKYPRGNPRRAGRHRRKQIRRRLLVGFFTI